MNFNKLILPNGVSPMATSKGGKRRSSHKNKSKRNKRRNKSRTRRRYH